MEIPVTLLSALQGFIRHIYQGDLQLTKMWACNIPSMLCCQLKQLKISSVKKRSGFWDLSDVIYVMSLRSLYSNKCRILNAEFTSGKISNNTIICTTLSVCDNANVSSVETDRTAVYCQSEVLKPHCAQISLIITNTFCNGKIHSLRSTLRQMTLFSPYHFQLTAQLVISL